MRTFTAVLLTLCFCAAFLQGQEVPERANVTSNEKETMVTETPLKTDAEDLPPSAPSTADLNDNFSAPSPSTNDTSSAESQQKDKAASSPFSASPSPSPAEAQPPSAERQKLVHEIEKRRSQWWARHPASLPTTPSSEEECAAHLWREATEHEKALRKLYLVRPSSLRRAVREAGGKAAVTEEMLLGVERESVWADIKMELEKRGEGEGESETKSEGRESGAKQAEQKRRNETEGIDDRLVFVRLSDREDNEDKEQKEDRELILFDAPLSLVLSVPSALRSPHLLHSVKELERFGSLHAEDGRFLSLDRVKLAIFLLDLSSRIAFESDFRMKKEDTIAYREAISPYVSWDHYSWEALRCLGSSRQLSSPGARWALFRAVERMAAEREEQEQLELEARERGEWAKASAEGKPGRRRVTESDELTRASLIEFSLLPEEDKQRHMSTIHKARFDIRLRRAIRRDSGVYRLWEKPSSYWKAQRTVFEEEIRKTGGQQAVESLQLWFDAVSHEYKAVAECKESSEFRIPLRPVQAYAFDAYVWARLFIEEEGVATFARTTDETLSNTLAIIPTLSILRRRGAILLRENITVGLIGGALGKNGTGTEGEGDSGEDLLRGSQDRTILETEDLQTEGRGSLKNEGRFTPNMSLQRSMSSVRIEERGYRNGIDTVFRIWTKPFTAATELVDTSEAQSDELHNFALLQQVCSDHTMKEAASTASKESVTSTFPRLDEEKPQRKEEESKIDATTDILTDSAGRDAEEDKEAADVQRHSQSRPCLAGRSLTFTPDAQLLTSGVDSLLFLPWHLPSSTATLRFSSDEGGGKTSSTALYPIDRQFFEVFPCLPLVLSSAALYSGVLPLRTSGPSIFRSLLTRERIDLRLRAHASSEASVIGLRHCLTEADLRNFENSKLFAAFSQAVFSETVQRGTVPSEVTVRALVLFLEYELQKVATSKTTPVSSVDDNLGAGEGNGDEKTTVVEDVIESSLRQIMFGQKREATADRNDTAEDGWQLRLRRGLLEKGLERAVQIVRAKSEEQLFSRRRVEEESSHPRGPPKNPFTSRVRDEL